MTDKEKLANKIYKANVKAVNKGKEIGFVVGASVCFGGLLALIPYCVPTVKRGLSELSSAPFHSDTPTYLSEAGSTHFHSDTRERAMFFSGFLMGIGGLVSQGYLYLNAAEKGQWEWLLLPVATNIISGMYEKRRRNKK